MAEVMLSGLVIETKEGATRYEIVLTTDDEQTAVALQEAIRTLLRVGEEALDS